MAGKKRGKKQKRKRRERLATFLLASAIVLIAFVQDIRSMRQGSVNTAVTEAANGWETIPEDFVFPIYTYDSSHFVKNGNLMSYEDDRYTSQQGIDVSSHNQDIDWAAVKAQGIEFAYIQAGYRGYTEGKITEDSYFQRNIQGALDNGIEVGVYFFSQAISEEEAREEARFVTGLIGDYNVTLPIFYDPEYITNGQAARTDGLSGAQITENTIAFANVIREAGYQPGLYCNKSWQDEVLDMNRFQNMTMWFAGFSDTPQTNFSFDFWQYTYEASLSGFGEGITVDMDIRMVPKT